jgi:chemotaxis protein MotA
MNVQTIVSLICLMTIFFLAFNIEASELGFVSNLNAIMIVVGGTFFATLLAFPLKKLLLTIHFLRQSFNCREEVQTTIHSIVNLARINKRNGIRSLEAEANNLPSGLIRTGIELITYQFARNNIEEILRREAVFNCSQYETGHKILCSMAKLAPAMGLAGTIINLIRVFGHISSPQSLMGYMAIALLSTFYGVVLANICFVPLSNKLREFMDQDLMRMDIVQEGILDIYDLEHPQAIQYKLETLAGISIKPYPVQITIAAPLKTSEENG